MQFAKISRQVLATVLPIQIAAIAIWPAKLPWTLFAALLALGCLILAIHHERRTPMPPTLRPVLQHVYRFTLFSLIVASTVGAVISWMWRIGK